MQYYPVIAGPTACGKTAVAVELARLLQGEVVSADSMQIYAGVSVGTARPDEKERGGILHHLQGFLPLNEKYSVARYTADARRCFTQVYAKGKTPILCGGTGLYIQAFMENIQYFPQPEAPAVRERLRREAENGVNLLERLREVDPETAGRLHRNDRNRIIRALEVYETTGDTIAHQAELSRREPAPDRGCLFVLQYADRERLYRRIEERVQRMLENGLLEEARLVLRQQPEATVLQAIGYKELLPYFRGETTLEEAVAALKTGTRHYAKRQLSWFRRLDYARPIYMDDFSDPAQAAQAIGEQYAEWKERSEADENNR